MTTGPPLPASFDELFSSNLIIVTGKGGVGKTTTAAALALAAVASGRRTLLAEVEGRQGFSRTFGTQPWDFNEREFRPGLWGIAIDPTESVLEYLELFYGLKRVGWMMERTHALDFVTTAAPGLRDLLLIGKVYEIEARKRDDGRRMYDTIVLDAPPTGRIVPFLEAPEGVTEIARVGPIRRQAGQIATMLHNPERTQAVLVTLLEEMPVTETAEAIEALHDTAVHVGPVVANQVRRPRVTSAHLDALDRLGAVGVAAVASEAGVPLDGDVAHAVIDQAHAHRERLALQDDLRTELTRRSRRPIIELPLLTGATFDSADLEILADVIAEAVGEPGPRAAALGGVGS